MDLGVISVFPRPFAQPASAFRCQLTAARFLNAANVAYAGNRLSLFCFVYFSLAASLSACPPCPPPPTPTAAHL